MYHTFLGAGVDNKGDALRTSASLILMKTASTFKVGSPDMVVYVSQAQQISFVEPIFGP